MDGRENFHKSKQREGRKKDGLQRAPISLLPSLPSVNLSRFLIFDFKISLGFRHSIFEFSPCGFVEPQIPRKAQMKKRR